MPLCHDRLYVWLRGEVTSICNIKFVHLVDLMFLACLTGESPRGGARRVREKTKLLYQPKPDPEIYIVPISSILGRLPLVLAGDHGTIPADMRNSKCQLFKYGEWGLAPREWQQALLHQPVGHVLALWPSEEAPDRLSLERGKHDSNHKHKLISPNLTNVKPKSRSKKLGPISL